MQLSESILGAWRTSSRTTAFLIEAISPSLWDAKVPKIPTKTERSVADHLHNVRCRWIRTLGEPHGIQVPERVEHLRVARQALLEALPASSEGIECLLRTGLERDGEVPSTKAYVWRNLRLDVGHVLSYFVGHEAHHRGQIVMVARQLGLRLPSAVTGGLWQWTARSRETAPRPDA